MFYCHDIQGYTRTVTVAFAVQGLKPFGERLTTSHFNWLDYCLAGVKKAGQRMESNVLSMESLEFNGMGDKQLGFPRYRVRTREIWDVRHIDAVTGKTVKEVRGLVYDLDYEFEQHDGVWLIDSVEVVNQKITGAPVAGTGSRRQ